ncbi:hypothetical protein BKA58DRAFT_220105 [Alternaria rosae]|uniref:uncharacterized protein n=1 Tax=Alternaria rosae TaxID=1187941 RepID=UPI001E8CD5DC|nr:uncharacterized protein BKA58DRAFT_220105 [Alternaria rosae]KAH6865364.1 hypothetical protein BKA58DRAFT_220105 [Alternaria rosae]
MPLLYGEGVRAFRRLQEEMLRVDEDYALFAWDAFSPTESLLARSPSDFDTFEPVLELLSAELAGGSESFLREHLSKTCFSVLPPPEDYLPPHLTSRGCYLSLPLLRHQDRSRYGCLACLERPNSDILLLCVMLRQVEGSENGFERDWDTLGEQGNLILLPMSALKDFRYASIYVTTSTKDHAHASVSIFSVLAYRDEGRSMLRISIDSALRSRILRFTMNKDNARPFPTEGGYSIETIAALPGMWSACYTGKKSDTFHSQSTLSVSLKLVVVVHVNENYNPWFDTEIEPNVRIQIPGDGPVPLSTCTWLLTSRPTLDRTLDRKTLRIQDTIFSEDFGWFIRLSIQRTGSAPLAPDMKQYVLTLLKK